VENKLPKLRTCLEMSMEVWQNCNSPHVNIPSASSSWGAAASILAQLLAVGAKERQQSVGGAEHRHRFCRCRLSPQQGRLYIHTDLPSNPLERFRNLNSKQYSMHGDDTGAGQRVVREGTQHAPTPECQNRTMPTFAFLNQTS
jgi:hypothetical protein